LHVYNACDAHFCALIGHNADQINDPQENLSGRREKAPERFSQFIDPN
jgi:hypothetical protein